MGLLGRNHICAEKPAFTASWLTDWHHNVCTHSEMIIAQWFQLCAMSLQIIKQWQVKGCRFLPRVPILILKLNTTLLDWSWPKTEAEKVRMTGLSGLCLCEWYRHDSHKCGWKPLVNKGWVKLLFICQSKYNKESFTVISNSGFGFGEKQDHGLCAACEGGTYESGERYNPYTASKLALHIDEHLEVTDMIQWCSYGFLSSKQGRY